MLANSEKARDIEDRAEEATVLAKNFRRQAYRVERSKCRDNLKMNLVVGGCIGLVLLTLVITLISLLLIVKHTAE